MANTTMMVYDPETQNHYRIQLVDTGSTDSHGNPVYQIGIDATAGGGGGAVSLPANAVVAGAYKVGALVDGADVAEGATTDAAVNGDNPGTISGKLRGLLKAIANKLPVTLADGDSVTIGTKADAAWDGAAAQTTVIGALKSLYGLIKSVFPAALSAAGAIKVDLASLIAGEDLTNNVLKVEQRFTFANITTNTSTAVKTAGGFLHAINVNTAGGPGGKAAVYDNASAATTPIGTIDTTVKGSNLFDVSTTNGIYIVTSVTSGSAADLTVSAR